MLRGLGRAQDPQYDPIPDQAGDAAGEDLEPTSNPSSSLRRRRLRGAALVLIFIAMMVPLAFWLTAQAAPSKAAEDAGEAVRSRAESGVRRLAYDYIVVGGGPSGSAMARMLSDDARKRVLLLEAGFGSQASLGGARRPGLEINGTDHLTIFDIPAQWPDVATHKAHHWDEDGVLVAKVLGGCGVHNAMLYVRALAEDFDKWDVPGWSHDLALRYYKRLEKFAGAKKQWWHGYHGILVTSLPEVFDVVSEAFLDVAAAFGIPMRTDFNKPGERAGVGVYHFNIRDGVRHSAARAFLAPVVDFGTPATGFNVARRNLHVVLGAEVTKVLLEDDSDGVPRAVGVEYLRRTDFLGKECHADGTCSEVLLEGEQNRTTEVARLRRMKSGKRGIFGEVILTAGALNTPRLLMVSGIGEEAYLKKLGISCRVHSPNVGLNLQDHPAVGISYNRQVSPETGDVLHPLVANDISLEEYERRARESMLRHKETVLGIDKIQESMAYTADLETEDEREEPEHPAEPPLLRQTPHEAVGWSPENISFGLHGSAGLSVGGFFNTRAFALDSRTARVHGQEGGHRADVREALQHRNIEADDVRAAVRGTPDIQLTVFRTLHEPHIIHVAKAEGVDPEDISLVTVALLNPEGRLRIYLDEKDPVGGRLRILPELGESPGEAVLPDADVDPKDDRNLNYHRMLTKNDRSALVRGMVLARELMAAAPLTHLLRNEIWPGPGYNQVPEPNADLEIWVNNNVYPNSHWCGTAAMGATEDAVLDARLRVRKVRGLRVADASAMPHIPNGNVHSTVLLMASRAAEMIREDADEDARAAAHEAANGGKRQ